jgi:hypothetical protein
MRAAVLNACRGIRWYLMQATGEAKWEEYLERNHAAGVDSLSRRDFERHRADHKENNPQSRCC